MRQTTISERSREISVKRPRGAQKNNMLGSAHTDSPAMFDKNVFNCWVSEGAQRCHLSSVVLFKIHEYVEHLCSKNASKMVIFREYVCTTQM